jgi:hypothetical protein
LRSTRHGATGGRADAELHVIAGSTAGVTVDDVEECLHPGRMIGSGRHDDAENQFDSGRIHVRITQELM